MRAEILTLLILISFTAFCFTPDKSSGLADYSGIFSNVRAVFVKNGWIETPELLYLSWYPRGVAIYSDRIVIEGVEFKILGSELRRVEGVDEMEGKFNYFGGGKSVRNIPTFGGVRFLFDGFEFVLRGEVGGRFSYDFVFGAGFIPERFGLRVLGAEVRREENDFVFEREGKEVLRIGDLSSNSSHVDFFVERDSLGYVLRGSFEGWDGKEKIMLNGEIKVINIVSTEEAYAVKVDGNGNVFVAGLTSNFAEFASSGNVFGNTGGFDVFVSKLNNHLSNHIATAIIGSPNNDYVRAIFIDTTGNVFIAGFTWDSPRFAPSRNLFGNTGTSDIFITKLDNNLSTHIATAILGSRLEEYISFNALFIDIKGNVYVAGWTWNYSTFAPSRNIFGNVSSGYTVTPDAFVSKFDNNLSTHFATAILSSRSLGYDYAYAVSVDKYGSVFIAGKTNSPDSFATSRTIISRAYGGYNIFVSKVDSSLSTHIASVIMGGLDHESNEARFVVIDNSGSVFIAGKAGYVPGFAPNIKTFGAVGVPGKYAFVSKFDNNLTTNIVTAFLGDGVESETYALSVDVTGNVYVAGQTWNSSNFAPSRIIFGQRSSNGVPDVFVTKLDNSLSTHVATAIIGSAAFDYTYSIDLDRNGNVFIAGWTDNASNFAPSRIVYGKTGGRDAFVTKLSGDLSSHIATAVLGSGVDDGASGVSLDRDGNIFVAGWTTNSSNFTSTGNTFGTAGGSDVFISKFNRNLSHIATAILGGSSNDYAYALAVDSSGNVFVGGQTYYSSDFAPSRNIIGRVGQFDGFVSKLSNDLSTHITTVIITSVFLDEVRAIAVNKNGNVFVTGSTLFYPDLNPDTVFYEGIPPSSGAVFVIKFNNNLSRLATAILTNGNLVGFSWSSAVALDIAGNVYVTGYTNGGAYFAPNRYIFGTLSYYDAFVSKLDNSLLKHFATAIFGSDRYKNDYARAVAVDSMGNVYLAGSTESSSNFAPARNIFGATGGGSDAFVTKLDSSLSRHLATAILAGNGDDEIYAISMDRNGYIYVTGYTSGYFRFAPSRRIFGRAGFNDIFVSKLDTSLSNHIATSIIGSIDDDRAYSIAIDGRGDVFVAGSTGLPSGFVPEARTFGSPGSTDAFLIRLNDSLLITSVEISDSEIPRTFNLYQNYPNPFNPSTTIEFEIPERAHVKLAVFDALGREVKVLVDEYLNPGIYRKRFDAEGLPSGVYFYRITAGKFVDVKKMLLVK